MKNEEYFIESCISSLKSVSDEIICLDDKSVDNSKIIAEQNGAKVYSSEGLINNHYESSRRNLLLEIGRQHKGTHFINIDADEMISQTIIDNFEIFEKLKKNEKISLQWLALWKSNYRYKNDRSVWSNNFKDFIFYDDKKTLFKDQEFHIPRTPTHNWKNIRYTKDTCSILHFQFSNWEQFQMKQCWYRCMEMTNSNISADKINMKYSITLEKTLNPVFEKIRILKNTKKIKEDYVNDIKMPDNENYNPIEDWRFQDIKILFSNYGHEKYLNLDIWHVKEIKELLN